MKLTESSGEMEIVVPSFARSSLVDPSTSTDHDKVLDELIKKIFIEEKYCKEEKSYVNTGMVYPKDANEIKEWFVFFG